jgi:multidrug efflux system membrane fusion protein
VEFARAWTLYPLARGLLCLAALVPLCLSGCRSAAPAAKKAPEVTVTTPIVGTVVDFQDFTGRIDALKTVDVRARVTGYVQEAAFREGDEVHEGDCLFRIDPRTYQADVDQAEANVRLADADRVLQEKNAQRAQQLIRTNSIAREDHDQIIATAEKARQSVGSMRASRDRAKLYLEFTKVLAPISGRVSRRNVDPGNLVNADQTVLTTIVSVNPVHALFDVDERTYLDLVQASGPRAATWLDRPNFPVLMQSANEDSFSQVGTVDFLDNRLSGSSGSIRMRGVFENPRRYLKPGLFARVRLPVSAPYQTILIPDEALMSDQGRKYVYVVDAEDEVRYQAVTVGQSIDGLRAIKDGLSGSERVIVQGMQRVRPKVKVEVTMQKSPPPPQSPLVDLLNAYQARLKAAAKRLEAEARTPKAAPLPESPRDTSGGH